VIGGTVGTQATNIARAESGRTASQIVQDALGEHYVEQDGTTKTTLPPLLLAGLLLGGGFIAFRLLRPLLGGKKR